MGKREVVMCSEAGSGAGVPLSSWGNRSPPRVSLAAAAQTRFVKSVTTLPWPWEHKGLPVHRTPSVAKKTIFNVISLLLCFVAHKVGAGLFLWL